MDPVRDKPAFDHRRTRIRLGIALYTLVLVSTRIGYADDVDQLMFARDAYAGGEYVVAEARLRSLVGREPYPIRLALVESTRRYFAAVLVFNNKLAEADEQIRKIFEENPDAEIDTNLFPDEVVQRFLNVGAQMTARREELRRLNRERAAEGQQRQLERANALPQIRAELETTSTVIRTPRSLMYLPFGVGQFLNGEPGAGGVILTLEVLGATAIPTGVLLSIRPQCSSTWVAPMIDQNCWLPGMILGSVGGVTLVTTLVIGLVQANTAWRAERVESRPRVVPPAWLRALSGAQFNATPTGFTTGVRVEF